MKCQIVSLTREERREKEGERARLLQPPPRPFKELVTTRGGRESVTSSRRGHSEETRPDSLLGLQG